MDIKIKTRGKPIPIEERVKKYKPLCDGLYPHEVLLLDRAPYYTDKMERFTVDWEYSLGIQNVTQLLANLTDRGYIRTGTLEESIYNCKVSSIKEQLKRNNLEVSGNKSILVRRLMKSVPVDELSLIFNEHPYKLTPKGVEILNNHEWVPYVHSKFSGVIDIWDFSVLMATPPFIDYKKKIWIYLDRKCNDLYKSNNLGSLRGTLLKMSQFAHENGDYEKAFNLLCKVTAFDLTYSGNQFKLDIFYICLSYGNYFNYCPNGSCRVTEYFAGKYSNYMNLFGWTEEELRRNIVINISNTELPIRLFTPEECGDIVIAEIHKDTDRLKKIYSKAKREFKKANKNTFDEIKELDKHDLSYYLDRMK